MGDYLGSTRQQQSEMLKTLGLPDTDALFSEVPSDVMLKTLSIPKGKSEIEVRRHLEKMAAKNTIFRSIFRGAGSYNHYIPALVRQISAKEEFVTAYTPYQPEISQGVLQSIFEYQTMICELTGLDASNASVYDAATAAAEAISMCLDKKKKKVFLSAALSPMTIRTIQSYFSNRDVDFSIIPVKDGKTDIDELKKHSSDDVACCLIQQPNYYGCIEDASLISDTVHQMNSKFVMSVHPIAITALSSPGECGADIAVGDAQPLGLPLSFGGPYIGFMAATEKMMRKLPGRIVGETTDIEGKRAFVLTMQAREQHIRREKAASNICSNQAHCALITATYMSVMGAKGIYDAAMQSYHKAHYLSGQLAAIDGIKLLYPTAFFNEFITQIDSNPDKILRELEKNRILGGLALDHGILWCVTEQNTKEDIDELVSIVRKAM